MLKNTKEIFKNRQDPTTSEQSWPVQVNISAASSVFLHTERGQIDSQVTNKREQMDRWMDEWVDEWKDRLMNEYKEIVD